MLPSINKLKTLVLTFHTGSLVQYIYSGSLSFYQQPNNSQTSPCKFTLSARLALLSSLILCPFVLKCCFGCLI